MVVTAIVVGEAEVASPVADSTMDDTRVLPSALVVVTGIVVGWIEDASPLADSTTDDTRVLPSALVVVTATAVGEAEVTSPVADTTIDDSTVLPWALVVVIGIVVDAESTDESVDNPASDELPPEDETTSEDVTEAPELDEPEDTRLELCSPDEDTSDEIDPREEATEDDTRDETAAAEEAANEDTSDETDSTEEETADETDSTEEETADEVAVALTEEESALDGAGVADKEDTLLLSPAEVLVALVSAVESVADSVVKERAVVDESEMMIGTVVEASVSELVVVPFVVACLFLSSALTATSCFAISTSRDARFGLSLWMCSIARSSASNTPFLYLGPRCPCNAACRDSEGKMSKSCLKSKTFEKSRFDSLGSGWLCATAIYMHWRPTTRRDRIDGMATVGVMVRDLVGLGRC